MSQERTGIPPATEDDLKLDLKGRYEEAEALTEPEACRQMIRLAAHQKQEAFKAGIKAKRFQMADQIATGLALDRQERITTLEAKLENVKADAGCIAKYRIKAEQRVITLVAALRESISLVELHYCEEKERGQPCLVCEDALPRLRRALTQTEDPETKADRLGIYGDHDGTGDCKCRACWMLTQTEETPDD